MLQSIRNEQTLKILEKLRKQGAPTSKPIDMSMTGGSIGENEEGDPQPDPSYEEGQGDDPEGSNPPGTTIQDNTIPGSLAMAGMRQAKKSLKRRY